MMKRLLVGALAALAAAASMAATTIPVPLISASGSTAGQAVISTGSSSVWGNVTATALAAQAANTVVANVTGSSASPTAFPMPSCSAANSALQYASSTGWVCGTVYALTTGTLAQFAATTSAQLAGVISDETGTGALVFGTAPTISNLNATGAPTAPTAGAGTNTTQIATTAFAQTAVTGGGNPGSFTTLAASGNDALLYTNVSGQSIATGTNVTVTGWTKTFDRLNTNFNASTGVFTAPATGYYAVSSCITFAPASFGAGNSLVLKIFANGVLAVLGSFYPEATFTQPVTVCASSAISLSSGQTLTVQMFQNTGVTTTLSTTTAQNWLSIHRIP